MKPAARVLVVLAGAVFGVASPALGDERLSFDSLVDAIRQAQDPTAAVAAYTAAAAVDRDNSAAAEAYVERMVELGVPEMAYAQAGELTGREPEYGLAWAVVADGDARRGQLVAALAEILSAVRYAHDDPFVQETAGALLAWFDTDADPAKVPAELRRSLELMRQKLSGETYFVDAYRRAQDGRGQPATTDEESVSEPYDEPLPPITYEPSAVPRETTIYTPYSYSPYVQTYPYFGYSGYCGSSTYFYPYGTTGTVIVPRRYYRDHDRDRDCDDHGRWRRGGLVVRHGRDDHRDLVGEPPRGAFDLNRRDDRRYPTPHISRGVLDNRRDRADRGDVHSFPSLNRGGRSDGRQPQSTVGRPRSIGSGFRRPSSQVGTTVPRPPSASAVFGRAPRSSAAQPSSVRRYSPSPANSAAIARTAATPRPAATTPRAHAAPRPATTPRAQAAPRPAANPRPAAPPRPPAPTRSHR